jgi:hypothetical protein
MAKNPKSTTSQLPAVVGPNVKFMRKELRDVASKYTKIADCVEGDEQVKKRGKDYLPMPNPADTSAKNSARYEAYKSRAVFYNVTQRTLKVALGKYF